ncbi:MAG: DUF305 domain-containing protein [Balneolaceae bacterium]|nr:DUF305 domain-containing protein [Balneolaceae bacterium]
MNISNTQRTTFLLITLLLMLGAAGCKSSQTATDRSASSAPSEDRMEELYWARIDSARMTFSQADVDFMIGMIGHHAQALIMSRLAPENGASAQLQILAARIINAQRDEINTMQTWLRRRGQPVPEVHIDGLNLMIHIPGMDHEEHADHTNMPGMLSQEQLVELSEAKGTDFDRLFLRYMIDHHMGAVTMVRNLVNTDGAAQEEDAFRLASDIQVDQITEIERMKLMLEELSDPGNHP